MFRLAAVGVRVQARGASIRPPTLERANYNDNFNAFINANSIFSYIAQNVYTSASTGKKKKACYKLLYLIDELFY